MAIYTYADAKQSAVIVEGEGGRTTVPRGHPAYALLVTGAPARGDVPAVAPVEIGEPVPTVPAAATRFQARAALLAAGLLDPVEAMVAASADPLLKLAWADALQFERHSPTVLALAGQLGLSDGAVDELFHLAATITA